MTAQVELEVLLMWLEFDFCRFVSRASLFCNLRIGSCTACLHGAVAGSQGKFTTHTMSSVRFQPFPITPT